MLGAVEAVEGDGQRLHQTGVLGRERFRQAAGAGRVDPGGVGHPTVSSDAAHGLERGRALLHRLRAATVAPSTVLDGEHRDPRAVVEPTGELVAEGHG